MKNKVLLLFSESLMIQYFVKKRDSFDYKILDCNLNIIDK